MKYFEFPCNTCEHKGNTPYRGVCGQCFEHELKYKWDGDIYNLSHLEGKRIKIDNLFETMKGAQRYGIVYGIDYDIGTTILVDNAEHRHHLCIEGPSIFKGKRCVDYDKFFWRMVQMIACGDFSMRKLERMMAKDSVGFMDGAHGATQEELATLCPFGR